MSDKSCHRCHYYDAQENLGCTLGDWWELSLSTLWFYLNFDLFLYIQKYVFVHVHLYIQSTKKTTFVFKKNKTSSGIRSLLKSWLQWAFTLGQILRCSGAHQQHHYQQILRYQHHILALEHQQNHQHIVIMIIILYPGKATSPYLVSQHVPLAPCDQNICEQTHRWPNYRCPNHWWPNYGWPNHWWPNHWWPDISDWKSGISVTKWFGLGNQWLIYPSLWSLSHPQESVKQILLTIQNQWKWIFGSEYVPKVEKAT